MNYRALIIDDEKDICFLISEILKDENFITESALNSLEAIKKFGTFKGFFLTVKRLLRCNPLGGKGYDPIPK